MSHTHLLIVHPDASSRALVASMIQSLGHRLSEAPNDPAAVRRMESDTPDLVLAGGDPSDDETLELLGYVRRKHPAVPVILLWPATPCDRVREATRRGAHTVLRFPLPATQLRAAVAQALGVGTPSPAARTPAEVPAPAEPAAHGGAHRHGHGANGSQHAHAQTSTAPESADPTRALVGEDPSLRQAIELAGTIAPTRTPVLVVGEPGTGKALIARTLHARSPRRDAPFVTLSCAGLKESALEAELFGVRGATPESDRPGRLAQAHGGTLYLDEVGALPAGLQYKLLRVLQDGEFEPVGSSQPVRVDCRLVLGSTTDLSEQVDQGAFRQDLYYRISVVAMKLPPLRHRGADIERLADHFRARFAREIRREVVGFTPEALDRLRQHDWPDNVQELENVVERAVLHCRGPRIDLIHLDLGHRSDRGRGATPPAAAARSQPAVGILPLKEALEGPERQLILQALEALNWNRQETARVLDINRTTLYKKMKKYGLLYDEPVWAN